MKRFSLKLIKGGAVFLSLTALFVALMALASVVPPLPALGN